MIDGHQTAVRSAYAPMGKQFDSVGVNKDHCLAKRDHQGDADTAILKVRSREGTAAT